MIDQLVAMVPGLHDILSKGIANNQFFVGMIGTGFVGGTVYFLRSLPTRTYGFFHRHFTSSLTLRHDTASQYVAIAEFLTKNRVGWYGRQFTATYGKLSPGYGVSYSKCNGKWIKVTRSLTGAGGNSTPVDQLDLVFWTRHQSVLSNFLESAAYVPPDNIVQIYFSRVSGWDGCRKRKRSLTTVFVNHGTLETLSGRLKKFTTSEEWYARRGTPYKFCAILEGPPGTGKTSLIHALASEYDYDICFLRQLSDINLVANLGPKSMVVIEDIDTLGQLNRDNDSDMTISETDREAKTTAKTMSFCMHDILNTLDGLATPHGLLVFITTNKIGDLDKAILRPGRVDLRVHMGPLTTEAMSRMFVAFYEEENRPRITEWISQHGESYEPATGATLQTIFLTQTVDEALDSLSKLKKPCPIKVVPPLTARHSMTG